MGKKITFVLKIMDGLYPLLDIVELYKEFKKLFGCLYKVLRRTMEYLKEILFFLETSSL